MSRATALPGPMPLAATSRPSAARWKRMKAPSSRSRRTVAAPSSAKAGDLQRQVVLIRPEPRHGVDAALPPPSMLRGRERCPAPARCARLRAGRGGRHRSAAETSSSRRRRRCPGRLSAARRRPRCRSRRPAPPPRPARCSGTAPMPMTQEIGAKRRAIRERDSTPSPVSAIESIAAPHRMSTPFAWCASAITAAISCRHAAHQQARQRLDHGDRRSRVRAPRRQAPAR